MKVAVFIGLAILFCLYLAFPDKVYVFDGILFSIVIDRETADLGAVLFNRRHLLFNPVMLGLRDLVVASGHPIEGYELVQKVNACFGVLGIWLYYRILARLTRDEAVSGICSLFLGLSCSYWSRATEGQVYMLMTFGALATAWASCALLEQPRWRRVAALGLAWTGAVLFHAANAVLMPMAAAALWLSAGPRRAKFLAAALAMALAVCGAYAWAFHIRGPSSLLAFLWAATEFSSTGEVSGMGSLLWSFFFREGLSPLSWTTLTLRQLSSSLVFCSSSAAWPVLAGALLCAALAVALKAAWPSLDRNQRLAAGLVALWGLSFVFLDVFWRGGPFFWGPPAASFLALAALSWTRHMEAGARRAALGLGACLVLAAGAWNLEAGIRPQSRLENNEGYRKAMFVKGHTVSVCWVATSGLGFGNSKVYLTKFAKRSTRALEHYLRAGPKAEALTRFRNFLQNVMRHGLPLYALSDLIEDQAVQDQFRKVWGVTPEEVRACFGPGRFVPIAAYDQKLRILLFVPQSHREALFAGLAFNVLYMRDPLRTREVAGVMERLGTEMTPESRRRTASLLEESRYGALLVFAGMSPYLDEQTRRHAQEVTRQFMQSPTPEARVALSTIYRHLGVDREE